MRDQADGLEPAHFVTGNPDEAFEWQRIRFNADHKRKVTTRPGEFEFRTRNLRLGSLIISRNAYVGATVVVDQPPADFASVGWVLAGRHQMTAGRDIARFGAGDCMLYPDGGYVNLQHETVTSYVTIDLTEIKRMADESYGCDPKSFRFTGLAPLTEADSQRWAGAHNYLLGAISSGALASPLVLAATTGLLVSNMLAYFPNTARSRAAVRRSAAVTPGAVRRAMEFMEAEAHRPLTATEIAISSGMSVRGLQYAFRRHTGVAPTEFLRRARLDRAHRDLLDADPLVGDTVADIARRWGFAHAGRFAAYYQKVYGNPPRQTLHA